MVYLPLHCYLDVVGRLAHIQRRIDRVFDAQIKLPVFFKPAFFDLFHVATVVAHAEDELVVVEKHAIVVEELKETISEIAALRTFS